MQRGHGVPSRWCKLLPVLLLVPASASAQERVPFRVDRWTTDQGLPSHTVNDLVQTPDGYLWIATTGGLVRFDGRTFETFTPVGTSGLPSARITGLGLGSGDTLWITTEDGHVVRRAAGRFSTLTPAGTMLLDVAQDADGTVWASRSPGLWRLEGDTLVLVHDVDVLFMTRDYTPVGPQFMSTRSGEFWVRDDGAGRLLQLRGGRLVPGPAAPHRALLVHPSRGEVLFVRERGALYDVVDSSDVVYATFRPGSGAIPRLVDRSGRLWVTTTAAIEVFERGSVEPVARIGLGPTEGIGVMIEDSEGNVWAATGAHGLIRVRQLPFRVLGREHGFAEDQVLTVSRGANGTVLATDRRWNVYRITGDRVEPVFLENSTGVEDHAWAAWEDRFGTLWLGRGTGNPRRHFLEARRPGAPPRRIDLPGAVLANQIFENPGDSATLWFADRRVYRYRPYDADRPAPELWLHAGERVIRHTHVARDGTLWVGTNGGLARVRNGVVTWFGVADGLPVDHVRSVRDDEDGVVWIGTYGGGIVRWKEGRFQAVREADGLAEDVVSSILDDGLGNFWMSGNRGVHRVARAQLNGFLDGRRARVESVSYGRAAGIPNPEASGWPAYRAEDGRLWFPTFAGVAVVDPAVAVARDTVSPRVHVEAVRTRDRTLRPDTAPLRLDAAERRLEIRYTGISLSDGDAVRFEYRLDGLDPEWIDAGASRVAVYTNLRGGGYTFRVRARRADGRWVEAAPVPLTVGSYFRETPAFYALAGLLLLSLAYAGYRVRIRQLHAREARLRRIVEQRTRALAEQKERAEQAGALVMQQAEQLRALDEAKSRFFENASHELRTPLALILAPLQDLEEGRAGELDAAVRLRVDVARRGGEQLGRLVDQLLDVARIDSGNLRLSPVPRDVIEFLTGIAAAFAVLAERAGIGFTRQLPAAPIVCSFDWPHLEKVLMNLLGNAFKFTQAGGSVALRAAREDGHVVIEVSDTGPGIAPDHLPHVFDRFYQAEAAPARRHGGIGVGLTLARELVHLHGGTIAVHSEPGAGTTFTVRLPGVVALAEVWGDAGAGTPGVSPAPGAAGIAPAAGEPAFDVAFAAAPAPPHGFDAAADVPTVLLVEDNAELRGYVRARLAEHYRVLEAADGRAGLALARQVVPDVVISDVMMPDLDGESLCRAIRDDPDIDFLPVILLTARASREARLSGLERGADDYLAKPFDMRELLVRIRNIIAARRRLRDRIGNSLMPVPRPPPGAGTDADGAQALLKRVYAVLGAHVGDEDFTVDQLAGALAMSRATLYRRLQPVIDVAPMELIWRYRLEQAAFWLGSTDASIAEVAYGVGFKSVPHFCNRFREQYGCSPSTFRSRQARPVPAG